MRPVFFFLLFWGHMVCGQKMEDGLYIPIDKKDCYGRAYELFREDFCIPEKPLFNLTVIEVLGDIQAVRKTVYFDLLLKSESANRVKKVVKELNQYKMVIVLDNEIVGLAIFEDLSDYTKIRFYSSELRGKIEKIHAYLQESLNKINGTGEG